MCSSDLTGVPFAVGQSSFSVYAKAAERFKIALRESTSTGATVLFDVSAGTVVATAGGGTPSPFGVIQAVGNGWYRCTMVLAQGTVGNRTVRIIVADNAETTANGSFADRTGDGVSGLFIWGAQLESGSFSSSYIPTTTAAATRAADVAVMQGANFSNWYNQSEGTLFVDCGRLVSGGRVAMFDDGSLVNRWEVRVTANFPTLNAWTSNVQDVSIYSGPSLGDPTSPFKSAASVKLNNAAISNNGNTAVTDTSCGVPANQSRLFIGSFQGAATFSNGTIRRIAYFPRRLADAELQAITS